MRKFFDLSVGDAMMAIGIYIVIAMIIVSLGAAALGYVLVEAILTPILKFKPLEKFK